MRNATQNPVKVPLAMLGRLYPRAISIKKNPIIKSQTIPIQAAFQDKLIATVRVATGPIMNPDIQSRSTVVNALTPVSLHQSGVLGKILHRVFRSHVWGHLQTSDTQSD